MSVFLNKFLQIWRDLVERCSQHILKYSSSNSKYQNFSSQVSDKSEKSRIFDEICTKTNYFESEFVHFRSFLAAQNFNWFVFGIFFHIEIISEIIQFSVSGKTLWCRSGQKYFGSKMLRNYLCKFNDFALIILKNHDFIKKQHFHWKIMVFEDFCYIFRCWTQNTI